MSDTSNESRLDRIEKELIEQEHRPIRVISNYLDRKKKYPDDQDLQNATKKAIIWRLFFSPGTIAATGGIIAIISLFLLWHQNTLISDQNKWFQSQILSTELSGIKVDLNNNTSAGSNYELINKYVKIQRKIDEITNETTKILFTNFDLNNIYFGKDDQTLFTNVKFSNINFSGCVFKKLNLESTDFINCNFNSVPASFFNAYGLKDRPRWYKITQFDSCQISSLRLKNEYGFGVYFSNSVFKKPQLFGDLLQFKSSVFYNCEINRKNVSNSINIIHNIRGTIISEDISSIEKFYLDKAQSLIEDNRSIIDYLENLKINHGRTVDKALKSYDYKDNRIYSKEILSTNYLGELTKYDSVSINKMLKNLYINFDKITLYQQFGDVFGVPEGEVFKVNDTIPSPKI